MSVGRGRGLPSPRLCLLPDSLEDRKQLFVPVSIFFRALNFPLKTLKRYRIAFGGRLFQTTKAPLLVRPIFLSISDYSNLVSELFPRFMIGLVCLGVYDNRGDSIPDGINSPSESVYEIRQQRQMRHYISIFFL
jgi:hypothetical protein